MLFPTATHQPPHLIAQHEVEPAPDTAQLGVHLRGEGVDVLTHAPGATAVYWCQLQDHDGVWQEHRYALAPGIGGKWSGHIPGIGAGTRYGFRVDGPWEPGRGVRFNPKKLVIDPYARGLAGTTALHPALYAHQVDDDLAGSGEHPSDLDSAPYIAHSVVMEPQSFSARANRPHIPWQDTVIYEAHVKGLTYLHPQIPAELRGTYAGLAHPAIIQHLQELGVTAVQLLPIHAIFSEPALTQRGQKNYWGYNTLNFFTPEPSYATAQAQAGGPQAVLAEFKGMVHLLHEAGLEVILDVVYNHTAEGGILGPTLSWRGLDDRNYYVRTPHHPQQYWDFTGCGNSLDFRNPAVVALVLDSLRYWAHDVGVDGFRFDLATTLGRRADEFDPHHPLWVAAVSDPIISSAKLIVEPWDMGPFGWRTGGFMAPLAEWNDRYRDTLRTFWLADRGAIDAGEVGQDLRDLATRIAGSADLFGGDKHSGSRGVSASINFITAHDGFTMADLTAFHTKRNEANGEDNRDGTDNNRSYNHGVEGPTQDDAVLAARQTSIRNLLASLIMSAGTPMLLAGDELGRTQQGNNNAYCQDSPIAWVDWELQPWQEDLLATTKKLLELRRTYKVLRPTLYRNVPARKQRLRWFDETGTVMDAQQWANPHHRAVQIYRGMPGEHAVLMLLNGASNPVEFTVGSGGEWQYVWSSDQAVPSDGVTVEESETIAVAPMSIAILVSAEVVQP